MGTYIVQADIEAKWGVDDVAEWATLENASPAVTAAARIAAAITWAEGWFEMRMSMGPYAVPVSSGNAGATAVIKDVVATFAGKYLYEGRGRHTDMEDARLEAIVKTAELTIDGLLNNRLRLIDGQKPTGDHPTAPTGVGIVG